MGRITSLLDKIRLKIGLGILAVKVMIGVSLILILAMGLFTYYDMVMRVKFHLKEQEKRAYEISDTVMRSIEYPMLDGEMEAVQAILEKLNRLKGVTVVDLCDTAGTIRYSGLPANIGKVDDSEVTKKALRTSSLLKGLEMVDGGKILHHAMPIPNEETCYKCHGAEKKILGVLTVGISWTPIEERIAALRNREITLGIVSVMVVGFFLTLFLSKYITRPLSTLTRLSDEISRGRPGFEFGRMLKCWEVEKCDKTDCPAHGKSKIMCWYVNGTLCRAQPSGAFPEKLDMCRQCIVYRTHVGDEIVQLADSFKHMLYRLKVYEEELKRSEEKYRSLIESADDMIYTIDRDCNILSINRYWTRLTKLEADEVVGKNITDIIEYKAPENVYSIVRKAFETSETFVHEEHVTIGKREYWLDTKYKPVLTNGDHISAVLVVSRDITEHKMIEGQLFHTEKLASLGSLSAGVAHEMNNPIAIILGFTELLLERFPENSKEYEILKTIERQGENCKRIVENLLAFARIPQKASIETNVVEDLQKVVNVVRNTLLTNKVDLKTDIDENLPRVKGDSQQLEQVFLNIINNAMSAMDGGGILTISAHRSADTASIDFTDTGRGIPQEFMDKIFEPFFTTKKVGEGTGLGLSVSYALVKKFGGDIRIKSQTKEEGKESGTTFTVLLPVGE
ncbi:MAG: PAS domain S-box protein [Desulfobacterales bacterium]|nr:PAS domain S-box protein [Desulfobacterales bacterium]